MTAYMWPAVTSCCMNCYCSMQGIVHAVDSKHGKSQNRRKLQYYTRYTDSRSQSKSPFTSLGFIARLTADLGQACRQGFGGHEDHRIVSGACCPSGMKLPSLPSCDSWTSTSTMPPKASRTFT